MLFRSGIISSFYLYMEIHISTSFISTHIIRGIKIPRRAHVSLIHITAIAASIQFIYTRSSSTPLHPPPRPRENYAFLVIRFSCFLFPFSLSLSKNFLCSSALIAFNFWSLASFLFLSPSTLRSSAFSTSSTLRNLRISSSRVERSFRSTSGR